MKELGGSGWPPERSASPSLLSRPTPTDGADGDAMPINGDLPKGDWITLCEGVTFALHGISFDRHVSLKELQDSTIKPVEDTAEHDLDLALSDAALRGRSEEALVRIVVPIGRAATAGPGDSATAGARPLEVAVADRLASEVASQLIPKVTEVLPHWEFRRGGMLAASVDAGEQY